MRRRHKIFALSGFVWLSLSASLAFAQAGADSDEPEAENAGAETNTAVEQEHQAEAEKPAEKAAPEPAEAPRPSAPVVAREATDTQPAAPKLGDLSLHGYFRGGFGASNKKGRQVCFELSKPGALFSKYRLGNECEVWAEAELTVVAYAGDDGSVAHLHFMPAVFIPNSYIGYPPNGTTSSPAQGATSTGATVSFPNLYVDLAGVPWLGGGTAWAGTRYYKRESVYISDFFYWNPSGVGMGVEDIHLGENMRLSYGAFAIDGEPKSIDTSSLQLPSRKDFGVRHDLQLRGIKLYATGELQLGFQYIMNFSDDPDTSGGWGVTVQHVQKLLGGENKLALQYGRGGGTGFGTLARYYVPDFSLRHAENEVRERAVDVLTIQPIEQIGLQATFVYQHDDLGNPGQQTDWISFGARVGWGFTKHAKALLEAGHDRLTKNNGSDPLMLTKATAALALSADRALLSRPELRLFFTYAQWNEAAAVPGIDSGRIYTQDYPDKLSGMTFGLQGETWW